MELDLFNKFEQLLDNIKVDWNEEKKKDQDMVASLSHLIEDQQRNQELNMNVSKYGQDLFKYFCNHQDRSKIAIKDFKAIPLQLYHALLDEHIFNVNGPKGSPEFYAVRVPGIQLSSLDYVRTSP